MALNRYEYRARFGNRCAVFAVIHTVNPEQAIAQTEVALNAGLDGVYLINHHSYDLSLADVAVAVRDTFGADTHIGVNFLNLSAAEAFQFITDHDLPIDGLWADNAEIDERCTQQRQAELTNKSRTAANRRVDYHGGVAFKYQRNVTDVETAAIAAAPHMDLICTSGPGTGEATDVTKLARMRSAIGDCAMSIASGVTVANVGDYVDLVDAMLVAKGISKTFTELDPQRRAALAEQTTR